GQRIELREKREPAFALDALQTGREHARCGGEEARFIMAERARARRHGTERTARAIFALNGSELRPLAGRPGEGQLATAAASLLGPLAAAERRARAELVERLARGATRERECEADPDDAAVLAQIALLHARVHVGMPLVGSLALIRMRDLLDRAADQLVLAVT